MSALGSALETLVLFTGLGALILLLAGAAVGRLSVVGARDVRAARRREVRTETISPDTNPKLRSCEPARAQPLAGNPA